MRRQGRRWTLFDWVIIFMSVLPWSLSCQRSCTPSLRTSWTGMSPRRSAKRKRRRRGTASTRRSLTKRWRPQRSHCSLLKLSYCQRRYWKSDPYKKKVTCSISSLFFSPASYNKPALFLSFRFVLLTLTSLLFSCSPFLFSLVLYPRQVLWTFSVDVYGSQRWKKGWC